MFGLMKRTTLMIANHGGLLRSGTNATKGQLMLTNLFHSLAFIAGLCLCYMASASIDNDYQSPLHGVEQLAEKVKQ